MDLPLYFDKGMEIPTENIVNEIKVDRKISVTCNFAHNVASDQNLWGWYVSATQEFYIDYNAANDIFSLLWEDGGTARSLASAQFDDGTAQRNCAYPPTSAGSTPAIGHHPETLRPHHTRRLASPHTAHRMRPR